MMTALQHDVDSVAHGGEVYLVQTPQAEEGHLGLHISWKSRDIRTAQQLGRVRAEH